YYCARRECSGGVCYGGLGNWGQGVL
nr:anti-SIV gp148 Ig heavy chain {CDR3 heavy chain region} [Macaca fascicularis=cynomolgus monkey, Peptide Partial, 25 aa] [Macaca fascicularis]